MSCVSRFSTSGSATATSIREPSRCVGSALRRRASSSRQERDDFGIDLGAAEIDDGEPELLGEHVGERAFAEQSELDEEVAEPLAGGGLLRQRLAQLVLGHEPAADEELAQRTTAVAHAGGVSSGSSRAGARRPGAGPRSLLRRASPDATGLGGATASGRGGAGGTSGRWSGGSCRLGRGRPAQRGVGPGSAWIIGRSQSTSVAAAGVCRSSRRRASSSERRVGSGASFTIPFVRARGGTLVLALGTSGPFPPGRRLPPRNPRLEVLFGVTRPRTRYISGEFGGACAFWAKRGNYSPGGWAARGVSRSSRNARRGRECPRPGTSPRCGDRPRRPAGARSRPTGAPRRSAP